MDISALSPILPGPVGKPADDAQLEDARTAASADFESFLTLLTAQLRNQDPLEPLDSTQFVAQLASFSTVEQLVTANERIDALAAQSISGDIAAFSSWIGKEVATTDGVFRATGNAVSFATPTLPAGGRIEAVVRDLAGTALKTFTVTPDGAGQASWDGTDSLGVPVSGRDLKIDLSIIEGGTVTQTIPAGVARLVTGIRGAEDGIIIELADGGSVKPEEVGRLNLAQP